MKTKTSVLNSALGSKNGTSQFRDSNPQNGTLSNSTSTPRVSVVVVFVVVVVAMLVFYLVLATGAFSCNYQSTTAFVIPAVVLNGNCRCCFYRRSPYYWGV